MTVGHTQQAIQDPGGVQGDPEGAARGCPQALNKPSLVKAALALGQAARDPQPLQRKCNRTIWEKPRCWTV